MARDFYVINAMNDSESRAEVRKLMANPDGIPRYLEGS